MKKWMLLALAGCFSIPLLAQVDSTTPPYKKFPTLPPLQILLGDSTTRFTKENLPAKKPVLLMLFSPECSHCQQEAEALRAHKEDIKNIQVVMVTFHPLWQMNEFVNNYKLNDLDNVVVGKDIHLILPSFYAIHNLPFHALYDKKGKLIDVFEGSMVITKMIEAFGK